MCVQGWVCHHPSGAEGHLVVRTCWRCEAGKQAALVTMGQPDEATRHKDIWQRPAIQHKHNAVHLFTVEVAPSMQKPCQKVPPRDITHRSGLHCSTAIDNSSQHPLPGTGHKCSQMTADPADTTTSTHCQAHPAPHTLHRLTCPSRWPSKMRSFRLNPGRLLVLRLWQVLQTTAAATASAAWAAGNTS